MTSLWFEPHPALAIAVAGPMTVTVAVVTIPRAVHRRISSRRMMKPPNKANEKIARTTKTLPPTQAENTSSALPET